MKGSIAVLCTFYTATAVPEHWNTEQTNFVFALEHFRNMRADARMIATVWTQSGVNPGYLTPFDPTFTGPCESGIRVIGTGLVWEYPPLSTVNSWPVSSALTGPFLQASWGAPEHSQISALAPPPTLQTKVIPTPPPQQYAAVSASPGPSQQGVWPDTMKACGILHKKEYWLGAVLATHREWWLQWSRLMTMTNYPVNVVFTLVHIYSNATPVITLTYHLCALSGSHLQVPLGLTNHVCQRSHAINVWLWQVRQCDDTGMVSLYMCEVNTPRWSEWQKRRIAEAVKQTNLNFVCQFPTVCNSIT